MEDGRHNTSEGELSSAMATSGVLEEETRTLAEKNKTRLRQELERLNKLLTQRDEILARLSHWEALFPAPAQPGTSDDQVARRLGRAYAKLKLWEAARDVLRGVGKPLFTADIAQAIVAGGKEIAEPRSSKTSSTLSQRDDVFYSEMVSGRKKRWGLIEWQERVAEK